MPLPLLLAGAAAAAALLGIGGHASAKEINEKAQELIQLAQKEYNDAKLSLEKAEKNCIDYKCNCCCFGNYRLFTFRDRFGFQKSR